MRPPKPSPSLPCGCHKWKAGFAPILIIGGACPGCPPESTPMNQSPIDDHENWRISNTNPDNGFTYILFIHFYSASHSRSLSETLPTTSIETVSEFTRRSATDNYK